MNAPLVLDARAVEDLVAEVGPLAAALGYEHRSAQILAGTDVAAALPAIEDVLVRSRA